MPRPATVPAALLLSAVTVEHSPPGPNRRTLLASVVFADIVGDSKRVVAQQIDDPKSRERFLASA